MLPTLRKSCSVRGPQHKRKGSRGRLLRGMPGWLSWLSICLQLRS